MKTAKRTEIARRAGPVVKPPRTGSAEPLDVSWHNEEVRAMMLWGERVDNKIGDGIEPASVEEE